jgi:hypothetical protein
LRFSLHLAARVLLAAFVLLTWAYGVASYSPFAFDMFIRPQLLPAVTEFVAWHHLWYWGPYLCIAASLLVDIVRPPLTGARRTVVRAMAATFVIAFGIVGSRLAMVPYLPSLGNDGRSLAAAFVCLIPLLWIAALDHVAGWPALQHAPGEEGGATGQRQLLAACVSAAVYLWLVHLAFAALASTERATAVEWAFTGIWGLALSLTTFMILYAVLSLAAVAAGGTGAPRRWEHGFAVAVMATGVAEVLRRIVLPAVSFDARVAIPVSVVAGSVLALLWSGVALRRTGSGGTALEQLLAPAAGRIAPAIAALVLLPFLMGAALHAAAALDWNGVMQKLLIVFEGVAVFAVLLRVCAAVRERAWSVRLLALPPLVVLLALYATPRGAVLTPAASGGPLQAEAVLDRFAAADMSIRLQAAAYVEQAGADPDYYRYLQQTSASSLSRSSPLPKVAWASAGGSPPTHRPSIFVFVIDSLRPDYLSPYNPSVAFTPAIDRFARDSFVFTNAFTRYGGTWLSMPSIWVGGPVPRGWGATPFRRINSLERLLAADGYRVVINDFTVAEHLSDTTPVTFLDRGIPSVDTDLCRNLTSLDAHLDATTRDPRPVFGYFAPMNVHLLNTRSGRTLVPGETYPGFYAAAASRVKRLDACFGNFVASLVQRGLYDDSIIIITSDHGDSIGERGNWGHQFWLFPEDVRVPLIVHVPLALKSALTTDLARVAFLTDIAPTMYALLGHEVRNLGPLFGSPLFVPANGELPSRGRDSFLLVSSYGPTYALLRRNGRALYVSDVAAGREFAFDLSRTRLGEDVNVSENVRRMNQQLIRERVAAVNALYGIAVR